MIGRNDPCHCGSGRKYKQCCLRGDQEASDDQVLSLTAAQTRREIRAAAAQESTWQAEVVPLPISIENERDARPVAALVTAGGFVLTPDIQPRLGGEPGDVAAALEHGIIAAAESVGSYPSEVVVRHVEVAELLRSRLEPRGVAVGVRHELADIKDVAGSLVENLGGVPAWPPACMVETWRAWGVSPSLIGNLFRAAAAFWRAAPWKIVDNLQAPRVTVASARCWTAGVLGNAGEQFGLAIYSDDQDLFRMSAADGPEHALENTRGRILSITFEPVTNVPEPMPGEARRHGWELAGPRAFPILSTINTPGGGLSENDARDLIVLLESLPRFVAANRTVLLREQRTGEPCVAFEWRDAATGAAFVHDGETNAELELLAGLEDADLHSQHALRAAVQQAVDALPHDADEAELAGAINEVMLAQTDDYNNTPQAELGNLSPAEVTRLVWLDWTDRDRAIQLRNDLPLESLDTLPLFRVTRALLALAAERDGLPATQHGYLRVEVVRELERRMRLDPDAVGLKRTTEKDFWLLHIARLLTDLAGLLERRNGKFRLTREGHDLLAEARAGQLFSLLFETCCRKFNLAYLTGIGPEWPELQRQVAFTFYRLRQLADEWHTAEQLMPDAVLPLALEKAPENSLHDLPLVLFAHRPLQVLVLFGLLEKQAGERSKQRYRKTPLYDRFLEFSFSLPPGASLRVHR